MDPGAAGPTVSLRAMRRGIASLRALLLLLPHYPRFPGLTWAAAPRRRSHHHNDDATSPFFTIDNPSRPQANQGVCYDTGLTPSCQCADVAGGIAQSGSPACTCAPTASRGGYRVSYGVDIFSTVRRTC